jgi:hypothetical protein
MCVNQGTGEVQQLAMCLFVISCRQEPYPLEGMGLRTVGRLSPGCCKLLPDQTQPEGAIPIGLRYREAFKFTPAGA